MRHYKKFRLLSILLILPSALAIFVFVYGFIAFTVMASFINWKKLKIDYTFVGFDNYIRLFHNERFIIDLKNTLTFTVLFLISTIVVGFLLAVALDQNLKGESFYRNIYLFPMALSFIVTGVVWRWLLAPGNADTGALGVNLILEKVGLGFLKKRLVYRSKYRDQSCGDCCCLAVCWLCHGALFGGHPRYPS